MDRTNKNNGDDSWILANEFAQVRLFIDQKGSGPRLCIEDLQTGMSVYLDSLVLAGLVLVSEKILEVHIDPGAPHRAA
jgi:hypothetical protein